ncbi:YkvA family protein [Parabacteroides sp. Marseille-P3160]|uniref:YkvA family protein n=1 Tax=Parabacteroides sp. Marseille-P3160 TaxID=1917887 RepID=UPI0009BC6B91|nr:YkvA family protein [Parabacteroides sp. Marseille-P3160]
MASLYYKRKYPIQPPEQLVRYGTFYSENRLWNKVRRIAQKVGGELLRPVLQLFYMLQDSDVSLKHKAYIVGALGYFIMPVDILPDFIAVLGFTDDLAVMTLLLKELKDNLTLDIKERADRKLKELLRNPSI